MARLRFLALLATLAFIAGACSSDPIVESTVPTPTTARPATTMAGNATNGARDEIQDRIDELIIEAQQIRGLEFLEPVEVILLSGAEYEARFTEIVEEDFAEEDIQAANAQLRMLGIIDPDDDYRQIFETLLTAGTVGFYDPDTGELVVRLIGDGFGAYTESVVIHELVHALQDQHFDLLDNDDLEGDELYVAKAIIEGDAQLRSDTYTQSLSLTEQGSYVAEISDLLAEVDTSALLALPGYIFNTFQGFYDDGLAFHQQIGIDAIDGQFVDLPESSEQLLDPDKYRRDEQPRLVVLPDLELPGYEIWFDATAGQKDIELLLTEGLDAGQAIRAAAGWGGDINRVYHAGDQDAVYVLKYLGDTKVEAEQLEAAFVEYIDNMVSDGAYTQVERNDDEVLVIIASDPAVGPTLRAAFSS